MSLDTELVNPASVIKHATDRDTLLIGGKWQTATGDSWLTVINPATEEIVARVKEPSPDDAAAAVAAARRAFDEGPWPRWSPSERADVLDLIADRLEACTDELALLNTLEVGAPLAGSNYGVAIAVGVLRYYAKTAREFPFRVDRTRPDGGVTRILREPVGVVVAIAPWNGPIGVAALKMAPALAAGCTVVLKSAPETPLATNVLADVISELVAEGAIPPGVISIVAAGREIGELLVANPSVDKITFTGSTVAGRRIMSVAAERIGRVTLELGGKSAAILGDDIALDQVLPTLVPGGCGFSGQVCFALTRVLVSEARHDEVVTAMGAALSSLTIGNPLSPATMLGPLAMGRQRDRVEGYIDVARSEGASVVVGGGRPTGFDRGYYIEATLLDEVKSSMRIAQEEIFGPVVSVITYRDLDEAVAIANDSMYGLSGAVYTSDPEQGFAIAKRVRTGTFSVNGFAFDTTVPFGGYKQSGVGREGGPEGMDPFLEYKSVHMPST